MFSWLGFLRLVERKQQRRSREVPHTVPANSRGGRALRHTGIPARLRRGRKRSKEARRPGTQQLASTKGGARQRAKSRA